MGSHHKKSLTIKDKYKICPICNVADMLGFYEMWLLHLTLEHNDVLTIVGELFCINRSVVIYKGKIYK